MNKYIYIYIYDGRNGVRTDIDGQYNLYGSLHVFNRALPQYLIDEHAGEDGDEDADHGEAKHSPDDANIIEINTKKQYW